jgi:hypothetical protein
MKNSENDYALLTQYVATFEKFDDLRILENGIDFTQETVEAFKQGTVALSWREWQPQAYQTGAPELYAFYQALGLLGQGATRFPPLYEALITAYRWSEVDLGKYLLLANEPSSDLAPLVRCIRAEEGFFATLASHGYWQFGRADNGDFDPICFDFRHRQRNGDCRVVRIDHEDILCRCRIREVDELAPNFRTLVLDTVLRANSLSRGR